MRLLCMSPNFYCRYICTGNLINDDVALHGEGYPKRTDNTAKHRVQGKVLGLAYTPVFFFNNTSVGAQSSMYTAYYLSMCIMYVVTFISYFM